MLWMEVRGPAEAEAPVPRLIMWAAMSGLDAFGFWEVLGWFGLGLVVVAFVVAFAAAVSG